MPPSAPVTDVAHVIQLSVAPVFLLTSIGTILSVLSNRLARIVDRARVLRDRLPTVTEAERARLQDEAAMLLRRRRYVHVAITLGTLAALFVSLVIASAFVGALWGVNVAVAEATLFLLALAAFVGALLTFLREVLAAAGGVYLEVR